ncbi:hypothetical protein RRG08_034822 [Elysia crispata]|uniref:Uncharacterized protein n=1 Tax=Elysia crispata TaxID=231223 RepID=A0AAE1E0Y7_9GAST|nr:hypothetical protein RRG08_034822 [Elysia crispata]
MISLRTSSDGGRRRRCLVLFGWKIVLVLHWYSAFTMGNIFRSASIFLKIALACAAVGLLLFVIGFATTSWTTRHYHRDDWYFGLWQQKTCNPRDCRTDSYGRLNDYHRAIQAMECLGLIGFILGLVSLLLYMCMDSFRRRDFLQASTAFIIAGLLFACIGFALFGSKDNRENKLSGEIGWSMGLAIAGSVLYGVSGICLILQLVR